MRHLLSRVQTKERNADYNRIVSTIAVKAQPRWLNKLAVQQNAKLKSSDKQERSKSSSAADRAVQMSHSLKKRYQPWIDQVSTLAFYFKTAAFLGADQSINHAINQSISQSNMYS